MTYKPSSFIRGADRASLSLTDVDVAEGALSFRAACVSCRSQRWGNVTPSVGLRRTCWRNRGREYEPTTRRRASWEDRCQNWMRKVKTFFVTIKSPCTHVSGFTIFLICMFCVDVDSLLKKTESQHESPEDGCPFGPLTQRLLQALVEVRLSFFLLQRFFQESMAVYWTDK